jgi:hypothetical protein
MRLGDRRSTGQTPHADLTGMDPFTGQFDEALTELGDVQFRNLRLPSRLYFYQK